MYRVIENREHPWSIQEFAKDRKEQMDCATQIITALEYNSNVLVSAPVKSGKRQIAEIVSIMYSDKGLNNKHYFITALNRIDTKNQIEELKKYGLEVIVLGLQKDSRNLIQKLKGSENPNNVIIHFDESDYGTGISNLFGKVFKICKERKIKLVCYSATNEEAEKSGFANIAKLIIMKPNSLYKGAEWFLTNNLVFEPESFFDGEKITQHGKEIIDWWLNQKEKPIGILRLTGGEKDKGFYKSFEDSSELDFLTSKKIRPRFIDSVRSFDWMEGVNVASMIENESKVLLIINQTCTRSTELGFHKHLAFLHDYRVNESNYSTLAQAYLRVAHYHPTGHKIRVYAEKEVFELAAEKIKKEEYDGRLSMRINKKAFKAGNLSSDPTHYFRPGVKLYIHGLDLDQQMEKIKEIWNSQIDDANKNFRINKWNEKVDPRLKFKIDPKTNKIEEIKSEALGGETTTTKRHLMRYEDENYMLVETLFHDGTKQESDITEHKTSEKSAYNQR